MSPPQARAGRSGHVAPPVRPSRERHFCRVLANLSGAALAAVNRQDERTLGEEFGSPRVTHIRTRF
jgi:hypothetical protein